MKWRQYTPINHIPFVHIWCYMLFVSMPKTLLVIHWIALRNCALFFFSLRNQTHIHTHKMYWISKVINFSKRLEGKRTSDEYIRNSIIIKSVLDDVLFFLSVAYLFILFDCLFISWRMFQRSDGRKNNNKIKVSWIIFVFCFLSFFFAIIFYDWIFSWRKTSYFSFFSSFYIIMNFLCVAKLSSLSGHKFLWWFPFDELDNEILMKKKFARC